MRQEGVRVASGRHQDELASGRCQDDVKRRGARINCHRRVNGLEIEQGLHHCILRVVHPREERSKGLNRISLNRRWVGSQIADCEASHSTMQHT